MNYVFSTSKMYSLNPNTQYPIPLPQFLLECKLQFILQIHENKLNSSLHIELFYSTLKICIGRYVTYYNVLVIK